MQGKILYFFVIRVYGKRCTVCQCTVFVNNFLEKVFDFSADHKMCSHQGVKNTYQACDSVIPLNKYQFFVRIYRKKSKNYSDVFTVNEPNTVSYIF